MLVLKRKDGQWVDITHTSGDVLRVQVCQIDAGDPGRVKLAFDDAARNFEIERPERKRPPKKHPPDSLDDAWNVQPRTDEQQAALVSLWKSLL